MSNEVKTIFMDSEDPNLSPIDTIEYLFCHHCNIAANLSVVDEANRCLEELKESGKVANKVYWHCKNCMLKIN